MGATLSDAAATSGCYLPRHLEAEFSLGLGAFGSSGGSLADARPRRHCPLLEHLGLGTMLIALTSAARGGLVLRLHMPKRIGCPGLFVLIRRPRLLVKIARADADSSSCFYSLSHFSY